MQCKCEKCRKKYELEDYDTHIWDKQGNLVFDGIYCWDCWMSIYTQCWKCTYIGKRDYFVYKDFLTQEGKTYQNIPQCSDKCKQDYQPIE